MRIKERFEEIKLKFNNTIDTMLYVPYEDVKFLIEQAERVQELEEDLLELVKQNKELRKSIAFYSSETYNAHLERLLDRSEKQIKRYREALEFYADRENYKPNHYDPDTHEYMSMIDHDEGATARKALEESE